MMGDDVGTNGWPRCGEIDIMENIGKEPGIVHGTVHGPGYSGPSGIGHPYSLPGGKKFADDFHVYAVEWTPASIRWLVDNYAYATVATNDLPKGAKWVYDHPEFILLNVAVGGDWPGNPDATAVFPQQMRVDYVRVYAATTLPIPALRVQPGTNQKEARWPAHGLLELAVVNGAQANNIATTPWTGRGLPPIWNGASPGAKRLSGGPDPGGEAAMPTIDKLRQAF
jgi:beta-glucanase (GH16 family)